MLIPVNSLVNDYGVHANGVLHLGAHHAEELPDYRLHKWGHVWWVEANPDKIGTLMSRTTRRKEDVANNTVIHALVGAREGELATLNVASNGESSSVLQFGTHAFEHPEVVMTGEQHTMAVRTVDMLALEHDIKANFLNLDLQGYELAALKGAVRFLPQVDWVYAEVNDEELYIGCPHIVEIDEYLGTHGFERRATRWTRHGWGDALYGRKA